MSQFEPTLVLQAPKFDNIKDHIHYVSNFHSRVRRVLLDKDHNMHELVHSLKVSGKLNNFIMKAGGLEALESPQQWFCRPALLDELLHPNSSMAIPEGEQVQGLFTSMASGFFWQLGSKACGTIFSGVGEQFTNIKKLTEKITEVVDRILASFEWIAEMINNASDFFAKIKEKIVSSIAGAFEKLKDLLHHFSYMLPLVCGILITSNVFFLLNKVLQYLAPAYQMSSFRLIEVLILIGSVIGIKEVTQFFLAFSPEEKLNFVNIIRNFFRVDASAAGIVTAAANNPNPTDQAQFDEQVQGGLLDLSVFGSIIACISLFMDREGKEWLQKISYSSAFVKNTYDGYDKCSKIVASIADWLYMRLGNSRHAYSGAAQALLLHSGVGIHDWLEECENIMVRGNTQEIPFEEVLSTTRRLLDQGKKISEFLLATDDGMTFILRQRFLACDKSIREFYGKMVQSKLVNQFRATPFVTVFYGDPGVGKSTVARVFADAFLNEMDEPQTDRIYARNPGDSYWSGYIRQPMVLYDDFAQTQQTNGMYDEASLIPLVSCSPYLLPMAAVEEKGRPFDSKYMVLCTNRTHVTEKCDLADTAAFYRRRHVFWKVDKNPAIPYNPSRCYDNLLFTLQDSRNADMVSDENMVRVGFLEMVAFTANKAQAFREKELDSLRTLSLDDDGVLRIAALRAGMNANANEVEQVQSIPVYSHNVFTIEQHMDPDMRYPNFDNMRRLNGDIDIFCLGEGGFFDHRGNTLSYIDWADTEIILAQKIERERTRFDVEGALRYAMALSGTRKRQHYEFMRLIDKEALVEREKVEAPNLTPRVLEGLKEHWDHLNDAERYLTRALLEYRLDDSKNSLWTKLRESLAEIDCSSMWGKVPVWCKWTIGIVALFAGGCALYKVFNGICSIMRGNSTSFIAALLGYATVESVQGPSSGGDARMSRAFRRSIRGFRMQSGVAEDIPHSGAWEKCERARVAIEGSSAHGFMQFVTIYGVLVGERKILIPSHFLCLVNWNLPCFLRTGGDQACSFFASPTSHFKFIEYDSSERVKRGNLALIEYSRQIRSFESYPYLDHDRATEGPSNFKGYIMSNMCDVVKHDPIVCLFERNLVRDEIFFPTTQTYWRNDHTFMAQVEGKEGMCGRLALVEKNGTLFIAGVHNFGRTSCSRFSDIPKEFGDVERVQAPNVDLFEEAEEVITPMVSKIGFIEKRVPKLSKSQIIKSPIYNEMVDALGKPKVEPTILSKMDPRPSVPYDPYESGIRKFDKMAGPFDFSDGGPLLRAVSNIESCWQARKPDQFPIDTVCSIDIAIQGVDGLEFAESFPVGTSEGFPYCFERKAGETGKMRYFEERLGKRYPVGDWPQDVADIVETAKSTPPEIFTMACAKDEKTKLSKIYDAPKTRIFEILPFTFNLAIRQYFMFWMQWMMKNHLDLPCKVGINSFSFSWDDMASKHTAYANHFCGDYSGFDTNTNITVIAMVADMVSRFANDGIENANIRRNLMLAAVKRKVLIGQTCYRVNGGTPSGFALTVMVNSVINEIYLKMSWFALANINQRELMRDQDLNYHVCMSVYGDDNVVSFTSHVAQWYNLETISKYLKQFGVILTDGKKSGIIVPSMPFEDIDFLKRKWVTDEQTGWFLCPLDKTSIESQLYWIKHSDDDIDALKLNVENAMREAFQHGKEYFQNLYSIVSRALLKAKISQIFIPTYEDAGFFWKQQRSAENLPIHYDDPVERVRFLTTSKEGDYGGIHCSTARAINKSNKRSLVDCVDALFVSSRDTANLRTQIKKTGAKHIYVSSKLDIDHLAYAIHELLHEKDKSKLAMPKEHAGVDKQNEIFIISDTDYWLAHAIGVAVACLLEVSYFKRATWISGLDDKAYKVFVELHGKLRIQCPCMVKIGTCSSPTDLNV